MRIITLAVLSLAALLSACGTTGKLDNVLAVTITAEKPRAFVNSTYWSLSIGAELREQDAQALADLLKAQQERDWLIRWIQSQQAQQRQQRSGL